MLKCRSCFLQSFENVFVVIDDLAFLATVCIFHIVRRTLWGRYVRFLVTVKGAKWRTACWTKGDGTKNQWEDGREWQTMRDSRIWYCYFSISIVVVKVCWGGVKSGWRRIKWEIEMSGPYGLNQMDSEKWLVQAKRNYRGNSSISALQTTVVWLEGTTWKEVFCFFVFSVDGRWTIWNLHLPALCRRWISEEMCALLRQRDWGPVLQSLTLCWYLWPAALEGFRDYLKEKEKEEENKNLDMS